MTGITMTVPRRNTVDCQAPAGMYRIIETCTGGAQTIVGDDAPDRALDRMRKHNAAAEERDSLWTAYDERGTFIPVSE